jgi:hypothetical protein
VLNISRDSRPVSAVDLALMRRMDELHLLRRRAHAAGAAGCRGARWAAVM